MRPGIYGSKRPCMGSACSPAHKWVLPASLTKVWSAASLTKGLACGHNHKEFQASAHSKRTGPGLGDVTCMSPVPYEYWYCNLRFFVP